LVRHTVFSHAFHAGAEDQEFLRRSMLSNLLPKGTLFFRGEEDVFAGRSTDQIAGQAGPVPLLDVVLDFGDVQIPGVIERRSHRRENTV
jgi:hypothetical protein